MFPTLDCDLQLCPAPQNWPEEYQKGKQWFSLSIGPNGLQGVFLTLGLGFVGVSENLQARVSDGVNGRCTHTSKDSGPARMNL